MPTSVGRKTVCWANVGDSVAAGMGLGPAPGPTRLPKMYAARIATASAAANAGSALSRRATAERRRTALRASAGYAPTGSALAASLSSVAVAAASVICSTVSAGATWAGGSRAPRRWSASAPSRAASRRHAWHEAMCSSTRAASAASSRPVSRRASSGARASHSRLRPGPVGISVVVMWAHLLALGILREVGGAKALLGAREALLRGIGREVEDGGDLGGGEAVEHVQQQAGRVVGGEARQ